MAEDAPPSLSIITILQGVVLAIAIPWLGSIVGSFTGDTGTTIGAAVGAVLSGVLGWLFLRLVFHTRRIARTRVHHFERPHLTTRGKVALAAIPVVLFAVWAASATGVEALILHKSVASAVGVSKPKGGGSTVFGTSLSSTHVSSQPTTPTPTATGTVPVIAPAPTSATPTTAPTTPVPATSPSQVPATSATPTPLIATPTGTGTVMP